MRRRFRSTGGALASWLAMVACSGGSPVVPLMDEPIMLGPMSDAGSAPLGADFQPDPPAVAAEPEPEASPDPPVLTPCPEGWLAQTPTEAGPVVCMPWPDDVDPMSCSADEVMWPGTGNCSRLGTACPAAGWPSSLPDGDRIYVDAAAAEGGDGSADGPYQRVNDALAAAAPGTVIALAPGVYPEAVDIPAGVTVWGACVAGTSIEAPDATMSAVTATGAGAVVGNLTVRGGWLGVTASGEDVSVRLSAVRIDAASAAGLAVEGGANADLEHVVVTHVQGTAEGAAGRGLSTSGASTVRARHLLLEGAREAALLAAGGAEVSLESSIIRDTLGRVADQRFGAGVFAQGGALVTLDASVLERNRGAGAFALSGTVRIADSLVRGTLPEGATGTLGAGLWSQAGTIEVDRVLLDGNHEAGILATAGADAFEASDVVVRSTRASIQGGAGIALLDGATGRVTRAWLDDNRAYGLDVRRGASAVVTDLTVHDTLPSELDPYGLGVSVSDGGNLTLERGHVEGCRRTGVLVSGASATLRDLRVYGTTATETEALAVAVTVQDGGELTLERALLEENQVLGLQVVQEGSHATVSDLIVRRMVGGEAAPVRGIGRGVSITFGGALELRRSVVEAYRDHGVFCSEPGSALEAYDVTVRDGVGNPDSEDPILSGQGRAIVVQSGATLSGERVRVERAPEAALVVGDRASAQLSDVVLHDTRRIGAGPLRGLWGRAINVGSRDGSEAELEIRRGQFVSSHEAAVVAFNEGTRLTLADVEIEHTQPIDCSIRSTACLAFGVGLGSYLGAHVSATRFRVAENALVGVQLARGGTVELSDGVVRSNPIGLNAQGEGIDFDAFTRSVWFVDNARNLDADELPTPGDLLATESAM